MITAIQLKQSMANTRTFYIVISKFGYWQELCLILLFKINKCLKIRFYYTILTFDFAISLNVEGGEELLLNHEKITK